jgi:RNA polymerase sigma-70 factor (ECF subfamily)
MAPASTFPPSHSATPAPDALLAATRAVRRYLRFLGCSDGEAFDLVQDALLAGLQRWPAGDAPVPWLLATARNLFLRFLRDRGRRRELLDCERLDALWAEQARDGTGDAVRDALRACLGLLPERSRQVLELRYGEGLDRAAIAARTRLGGEGVKSLLARTRALLADCVRRRTEHG